MRNSVQKLSCRLLAAATLLLVVVFSGCNQRVADDSEMKAVGMTAPGTPWHEAWMILKDRLANNHEGTITPNFYITGQLGSEESTLSQLRRGRIQIGGFSLQGASSIVPELGILLAPYLFDSVEEADFVMDNYGSQAFAELFASKGVVLLSWAEVGWTYIYGKEPILIPEDARHLKLRSSNALSSQLMIRAIGADMVPLPFSDIMPSLQTGLIDGGESGSVLYSLVGLPKEAPHLTLTRHAFDTGMYLANKDWFDRLSGQQRNALQTSLLPVEEIRKMVRASEQEILANPEKHGIKIHHLTPEQKQLWRNATAKNHPLLIERIGGEAEAIYAVIMEGKKAFKQKIDQGI
jgi:TRAP-type C4-dicarboxylate transport system substrate-binding protein